jgi:hypothetical protein
LYRDIVILTVGDSEGLPLRAHFTPSVFSGAMKVDLLDCTSVDAGFRFGLHWEVAMFTPRIIPALIRS